MEFVQKFTPLDFQAKNYTPSISPNLDYSSLDYSRLQGHSDYRDIWTIVIWTIAVWTILDYRDVWTTRTIIIHLLTFAFESYIYETDFTVKNITFKSSYNWFKIVILRQLRPLPHIK